MSLSYLLTWDRNKLNSWEKTTWWLTQVSKKLGTLWLLLSFMDYLSFWGTLGHNFGINQLNMFIVAGVWGPLALFCLGVVIGKLIIWTAWLYSSLDLYIWLNCFVLHISKWKNPIKKQLGSFKAFPVFLVTFIIFCVHFFLLLSSHPLAYWLV